MFTKYEEDEIVRPQGCREGMGARLRVKLKYALNSLSAKDYRSGPCVMRRTGAVFVKARGEWRGQTRAAGNDAMISILTEPMLDSARYLRSKYDVVINR